MSPNYLSFLIAFLSLIIFGSNTYAQFDVNGNASQTSCNCYDLTQNANSQVGAVWNTNMIDLNDDFDFTFQVYLGSNDGGADGIVFGLQPLSTNVGVLGGGMGLGGVTPSVGVYIDTYQNGNHGDPWADHIAINANGDVDHATANNLAGPFDLPNVEDGLEHVLRVVWDAGTTTYTVYFDGAVVLTYTADIINTVFGGDPNVFWGFAGATGGLANDQRFCLELDAAVVTPSGGSGCPGTPFQFNDNSTSFGSITGWQWDFGDGNTSTDQNPSHMFTSGGNYSVNLTVTDNSGCTSSASTSIILGSPSVTATANPTMVCAGETVNLDLIIQDAPPPACTYTLTMWDSYGDGWNGGAVDVLVNGNIVASGTLTGGYGPESITFPVNDGDAISTVMTFGSYVTEMYYYVYDGAGTQIFSDGCDGSGCSPTGGAVGTASCPGVTPNYQYEWSPSSSVSDPNIQNPTAQITSTTVFGISLTDTNNPGCVATDQITVTVGGITVTTATTDESCSGVCDGSFTASVVGGDSNYTYSWSDGTTTPSNTTACSGNYSVTVTDGAGCSVIENALINAGTTITANITCPDTDLCDGESFSLSAATSIGLGGTPTYDWELGDGSNDNNTVSTNIIYGNSGSYTATVTMTEGACSDQATITLTASPIPNVDLTDLTSACGSGSPTILATGVNGTANYTYTWSNGFNETALTSTQSGLTAGSYTVSIADANGCENNNNISISSPVTLSVTTSCNDVTTPNGADGSSTAIAAGGTAPYNYLWSNGQATQNLTNVVAGTYQVTATDQTGCTAIHNCTVTQITCNVSVSVAATDGNCASDDDGSATATFSGSVGSTINYVWSNLSTAATANGLSDGNHTVIVSDEFNCTATETFNISSPTALAINTTVTDVSCGNGTDGAINTSVSGGTSTYAFAWSNGQASQNITNLSDGSFSVTVTDQLGCTNTVTTAVSSPPSLTVSSGDIAPSCFGVCDGQSVIAASGGTGGFHYLWSSGETTLSVSNLCDGAFSVTISDDQGCSEIIIGNVSQPSPLWNSPAVTNASCNECNGNITLATSGGTAPYNYTWESGEIVNAINNLCTGIYTVTVTDDNGCSDAATHVVADLTMIPVAQVSFTQPICNGQNNGSATAIIVSSGSSISSYVWSDGNNGQNAYNVVSGPLSVTVTDASGCTTSATTTITEPTLVLPNLSANDLVLCDGEIGFVSSAASGGIPPYINYTWSDDATGFVGPGPLTAVLNPGQSGTFTVQVMDSQGCTNSQTITVQAVSPLQLSVPDSFAVCIGETTQICVNGSGGVNVSAYTFDWINEGITDQPGSTTSCQTLNPTASGYQYLSLSDGCSAPVYEQIYFTIGAYPPASFVSDVISGCEPLLANFEASSDPDFPNLTYAWDFENDGIIDSLGLHQSFEYDSSGIKDVTLHVTSEFGCTTTITEHGYIEVYDIPDVFIQPEDELITLSILHPTVSLTGLTSIEINANELHWDFGDASVYSGETVSHSYQDTGLFDVRVTAITSHGCVAYDTLDIYVMNDFDLYTPNAFTPNDDGLNDQFLVRGIGYDQNEFIMRIFNRWGELMFSSSDPNEGWDGTFRGNEAPSGTYIWQVNAQSSTNRHHEFKEIGHVILLR